MTKEVAKMDERIQEKLDEVCANNFSDASFSECRGFLVSISPHPLLIFPSSPNLFLFMSPHRLWLKSARYKKKCFP